MAGGDRLTRDDRDRQREREEKGGGRREGTKPERWETGWEAEVKKKKRGRQG